MFLDAYDVRPYTSNQIKMKVRDNYYYTYTFEIFFKCKMLRREIT